MHFSDSTTLGEVRKYIKDQREEKGTHCPACQGFSKNYRYSVNALKANLLTEVLLYGGLEPVHVSRELPHIKQHGGELAKTRHWGLLEPVGNHSGVWRVTLKGKQFLKGNVEIPEWIITYNNVVIDESENMITAEWSFAKSERFNFVKHMLPVRINKKESE
jgi:hypothetical protein